MRTAFIVALIVSLPSIFFAQDRASCNALHFDGVDDFVSISNPLLGNPDFTIEFWINTQSNDNDFRRFIGIGGTNTRFEVGERDSRLTLFYFTNSVGSIERNALNIPNDNWYHIAIVKQRNFISIYFDGELQIAVDDAPDDFNFNANMRLGRWPGGSFSGLYIGAMKEVRIWNNARTLDEIRPTISCELSGDEAGLIAYYNMNQGLAFGDNAEVTTLIDASNSTINGTLNNFALTGDQSNWVEGSEGICRSCSPACELTINCPEDLTVNSCNAETGVATASSSCEDANISITSEDVFVNGNGCDYIIERTWTAIDFNVYDPNNPNSEGIATCVQTIQYQDQTAPTIQCPENVQVFTNDFSGDCGASVNLPIPTVRDDCEGEITIINSINGTANASGFYPVGTTEVTWTAVDACGNSSTCTITVTVIDATSPTVVCESILNLEIVEGDIINLNPEDLDDGSFDNCGQLNFELSQTSFGCEDAGTNTITLTVTDGSGNSNSCTIEVNVAVNFEFLGCPENIVVEAPIGTNGTVVNFTPPSLTDRCPFNLTNNFNSGDFFPCGTTTVIYTATDLGGNETICSFDITVNCTECTEAPVILNCPEGFSEVIGCEEGAIVEYEITATDDCDEAVEVVCSFPSGTLFPEGTTTVTCTATDSDGNLTECVFDVLVTRGRIGGLDLNCPESIELQIGDSCLAVLPEIAIEVSGGCPEYTIVQSIAAGTTLSENTTITITVTDGLGLVQTCEVQVILIDNIAPTIECPDNITVEAPIGTTGINVDFPDPVVSDNCEVTFTCSAQSGDFFECGVNVVTCTATDEFGNEASCEFTITVGCEECTEAPVILNCPEGFSEVIGCEEGAIVEYEIAATDDCDGAVEVVCSFPSGTLFPEGTTTVTCTATDSDGNTTECVFDVVVVKEVTDLSLNCPETIELQVGDSCLAIVPSLDPEIIGGCPDYSITQSIAAGTEITENTTITVTVTDGLGQIQTCDVQVILIDNIVPTIECPDNITVEAPIGTTGINVDFPDPVVSDNCEVTWTCTAQSGDFFECGVNVVTCTATDEFGNEVRCEFTITVNCEECTQAPTFINCPEDFGIIIGCGEAAILDYNLEYVDDCDDNLLVLCSHPPGTELSEGVTTVVCSVTDFDDNTTECSFDVTVTKGDVPTLEVMCFDTTLALNDLCDVSIPKIQYQITGGCPEYTITQMPAVGTIITENTTVVITVTDESGQTATCEATIALDDFQAPVITCPEDIVVDAPIGANGVIVEFPDPVVADNCEVTWDCSFFSGDFFECGTTTVTCVAIDQFGNTDICSFDITVNCEEIPPCDSIELVVDTFYCNSDKSVYYEFSLINNSQYTFEQLDLYDSILDELFAFNPAANFQPGDRLEGLSRDFFPNEDGMICVKAFLFNFTEDLCCHTEICVDVPMCINCDSLAVQALAIAEEDCCYELELINNDGNIYTQVVADLTTSGITFSKIDALSTDWIINSTSTSVTIEHTSGTIPLGSNLPLSFCLDGVQTSQQVPQQIVCDWVATIQGAEEVVCRDTLITDCECAVVENELLTCNTDGTIQYSFDLVDQTDQNVSYLRFDVLEPAGIEFDNCLPRFMPVTSAASYPISLTINDCGTPLLAGTEVKYRVSMLEEGTGEWCCHLDTISILLPDCERMNSQTCNCENSFEELVQLGFNSETNCNGLRRHFSFTPKGNFESCDNIFWSVNNQELGKSIGKASIDGNISGLQGGNYECCMTVSRTAADGSICEAQFCESRFFNACRTTVDPPMMVEPSEEWQIRLLPNPVNNHLQVKSNQALSEYVIFNIQGQIVQQGQLFDNQSIDTRSLAEGLYFLQLKTIKGTIQNQRFIKQ